MFYFLVPLKDWSMVFNLFRYITFRAGAASVTAFLLSLWLGPVIIRWLMRIKATANQQREYADPIHDFFKHKKDVPTMGGFLIVTCILISVFLWGNLTNRFVLILIASIVWFGAVGFFDDWMKIKSKNTRGLSSRRKLAAQIFFGAVVGLYLYMDPDFDKWLYLPMIKHGVLYLNGFLIPFVVLVLAGSSNALNLTDGLDGLAIGCTLFASGALAVICYIVGRFDYAGYLNIPHIPEAGELTVVAAAIMGASAGFLWYNGFPAQVMMGDTGSLSLGGALGTIAVLIKKEMILVIIGGVFVWETLSVILQVISFKLFHKRIFLMSPFHHHLQLKGWPESKVTVRLWIIAFILALVGLGILKVR